VHFYKCWFWNCYCSYVNTWEIGEKGRKGRRVREEEGREEEGAGEEETRGDPRTFFIRFLFFGNFVRECNIELPFLFWIV
jgi:hypothetical protein